MNYFKAPLKFILINITIISYFVCATLLWHTYKKKLMTIIMLHSKFILKILNIKVKIKYEGDDIQYTSPHFIICNHLLTPEIHN